MKRITKLKKNEIFVFGSNLLGIHGAGAAKDARELFGAEIGIGVGMTGRCYAIPTKRSTSVNLSMDAIRKHVEAFLDYAKFQNVWHPERVFILTPIGCGLAGFTPEQIAPMFDGAPSNVILPPEFEAVLRARKK